MQANNERDRPTTGSIEWWLPIYYAISASELQLSFDKARNTLSITVPFIANRRYIPLLFVWSIVVIFMLVAVAIHQLGVFLCFVGIAMIGLAMSRERRISVSTETNEISIEWRVFGICYSSRCESLASGCNATVVRGRDSEGNLAFDLFLHINDRPRVFLVRVESNLDRDPLGTISPFLREFNSVLQHASMPQTESRPTS